jgi:hypothetical protein
LLSSLRHAGRHAARGWRRVAAAAAARRVDDAAGGPALRCGRALTAARLAHARAHLPPRQVVTTAAAALDDVCKLHHPDPSANPAVRCARAALRRIRGSALRPPARLRRNSGRGAHASPLRRCAPSRQVTAATHKRLRGRAAAQLRLAQERLLHVSSRVRPPPLRTLARPLRAR